MKTRCAAILTIALLSVFTTFAQAVDCSDVFPTPASSSHPNGVLDINWLAKIYGSSAGQMAVNRINQINNDGDSCPDAGMECVSIGPSQAGNRVTIQTGNGGNNIQPAYQEVLVLGDSSSNPAYNTNTFADINASNTRVSLTFAANPGGSADTEYFIRSINLGFQGVLRMAPGTYWVENDVILQNETQLVVQGSGTVRLFIGGQLRAQYRANLNQDSTFGGGDPEQLLVYTAANITLDNEVEASMFGYANGQAQLQFLAEVSGALHAANRKVIMDNESVIRGSGDASMLDFAPLCDGSEPADLNLQYGRSRVSSPSSNGATVSFDQSYDSPPLVFLMTPIDSNDPDNDGPVVAILTSVNASGFTWARQEPPNNSTPSQNIQSVDWIAINQGEFTLSDGRRLLAGSVPIDNPQGMDGSGYELVSGDTSYDVWLTQMQTRNNNCWLTSLARERNGIRVALDVSGATDGTQCYPGGLTQGQLQQETVGYLLAEQGFGTATINGQSVQYQFGLAANTDRRAGQDPSRQCAYINSYQSSLFSSEPVMVGGKGSRKGTEGGWLRRCLHDAQQFTFVVDEDQYQTADRKHQNEDLSYMAFSFGEDVGVPGLEISAASLGLTCDIHEITLRATLDGQTDQSFVGSVALSTSTNRGIWSTIDGKADGSLTPDPQTDNGSASYQFVSSDQGEVTLGLFHALEGDVEITVADGALNASTTVSLSAYGLRGELTSTRGWGANPHIANEPFSLTLTAVGKDESGADCSPLTDYAGSKNIAFWSDYVQPSSGTRQLSVEGNAVGASEAARTTLAVSFSDGESDPIALNYNDAGRLAINYWDEAGSIVDDATVTLRGSNGADVLPAALVWTNVEDGSGGANPQGTATDGSGFVAAGAEFSARLQALVADCTDASNINCQARNFVPDNSAVISHKLETPAESLGGATGSFVGNEEQSWSLGGNNFGMFSWSEVGSIVLSGEVEQYLGWDVSAANSDNLGVRLWAEQSVGRFYPAYYELLAHATTSLAPINPGCGIGGFTYTGATDGDAQHLAWKIEARNASGALVSNYERNLYNVGSVGQSWRATPTNVDNRLWVATPEAADASAWADGVINYPPQDSTTNIGLASGITKSLTAEVPTDGATMQIYYQGLDGSILRSQANVDNSSQGFVCDGTGWCELGTMPQLRHGRIFSPNSFGSELESIRVQPQLQYVDANGQFVLNSDDNGCTVPLANYWQSDNCTAGQAAPFAMTQEFGASQNGLLQQRFDPGNQMETGQVCYWYDHDFDPTVPSLLWLRDDWNGDGAHSGDDDRAGHGEVSFGWFRQNDRVIFRRSL
ncbi:DUF6701 domain-containing protein [Aliagarivorans taiwanensis]|uniref:DUF6701 domain-containing protein n=1 Tax=Aliagarivorans taiwanensis TaxID=561966 RepID=UPI000406D047|nr:DUF6701 domain-containing protein [Aliagarivorans taiwanensis]